MSGSKPKIDIGKKFAAALLNRKRFCCPAQLQHQYKPNLTEQTKRKYRCFCTQYDAALKLDEILETNFWRKS